jgi:formylglycine-generating enzyme required for sulfatase activity
MNQANPSRIQDNNNPVEQVTWFQAVDFCNRLSKLEGLSECYTIIGSEVTCNWSSNGYRLLTEAEWEYACRAGSKGNFGNLKGVEGDISKMGWTANNTQEMKNVGLLQANDFGLYDMHGNAAEWVWDIYEFYDSADTTNPTGPTVGQERCFRGGSYRDGANSSTTIKRESVNPAQYQYYIGFRVCRRK